MARTEAKPSERIRVRTAPGGLEAIVSVRPGVAVEEQELERALLRNGICFGIDEEVLAATRKRLAEPSFNLPDTVIARGTPPAVGDDGVLELAFRPGLQAGTLREDGSLDYHDRELLKPIVQGTALGSYRRPKPGTPGRSVDGRVIAARPGRDTLPRLGQGVELVDDDTLQATRDGVVEYRDGKQLDVVALMRRQGDVDYHSGDLEMEGSLVIQGNIARTFSVRATSDVEVRGLVDGGGVLAGGDVKVSGGVVGAGLAKVMAGAKLVVRYAQAATLQSGEWLEVQSDAVDCHLASQEIRVGGRLIGGEAHAEKRIEVRQAGSAHGGATVLVAAEPLQTPVEKARVALATMKAERDAARWGGRPQEATARLKGGKRGRAKCEMERVALERKRLRAKRAQELLDVACIEVQGTVYPGVAVRFGDRSMLIDEPVSSVGFWPSPDSKLIRMEKLQR